MVIEMVMKVLEKCMQSDAIRHQISLVIQLTPEFQGSGGRVTEAL
jgi:hypothetical protein